MRSTRDFVRPWFFISIAMLAFFMVTRIWSAIHYGTGGILEGRWNELPRAFWMGFRFDLSAVGYLNTVPVLVFILWWCFPNRTLAILTARTFRIWFGIFVPLYVFITAVDFLFYDYFQDHLNTMIFGFINDDTSALVKTMWKNYNSFLYFALFIPATVYFGYSLGKWFPDNSLLEGRNRMDRKKVYAVPLTLFVGVFLISRGSVSMFPLNVADASVSSSPFVNYIAFSGVHSFVRAVKLRKEMTTKWNINAEYFGYGSLADAAADAFHIPVSQVPADPIELLKKKTGPNPWAERTRPHVVVVMMESFGTSWLKYHRDSFNLYGALEQHFHSDITFENFLPSMTATIGSLSAMMINSPHKPFGEFLTEGRFFNVPFRTAPARVFKAAGYKTRFLYGGAIGWRNVDRFARLQGFDSIEGDYEIEKYESSLPGSEVTEKHDWGNHDGPVFRYLEHTLSEATEPQFVLVMTTTNHPPFQLPTRYQALPINLPEELSKILIVDQDTAVRRFRAFQYSNQVLGELMDRIKKSPLGEKTIVAATGDHGFLLINFEESDLLQKWQVPFYLYLPKAAREQFASVVDTKVFGSHPDIFPTLYQASLPNTEYAGFGVDLIRAPKNNPAMHYSNLALNEFGAVVTHGGKSFTALGWDPEFSHLAPIAPTPELNELAKHYQSTMSFLDYFYEFERKHAESSHANSGR